MCLFVLRKNFIDFFLLNQLLRLVLAHFLYILDNYKNVSKNPYIGTRSLDTYHQK